MAATSLKRVGVLLGAAGLGAGAFFAGRAIVGLANPAPPEPPVQVGVPLDPGPYFEGLISGIRIVPVAKEGTSDLYCAGDRVSNAPYAVAQGTVWEISPTYLPPGAVEHLPGYVPHPAEDDFVPVTLCDGLIARSLEIEDKIHRH